MQKALLFLMMSSSPLALAQRLGPQCSNIFRSPENLVQAKTLHKVAVSLSSYYHRNQFYGDHPYSYHIKKVRSVMKRFGFGPKDTERGLRLGTAIWLHDIVEDTAFNIDQIRFIFGNEIADIVWAVTNIPKSMGLSKQDRKIHTFQKIALNPEAILVKLFDRIANVEESIFNRKNGNVDKLDKYIEEWPLFEKYLRKPGEADALWLHLESLMKTTTTI